MTEKCAWCESEKIKKGADDVYWELPDGTRAIKISEVPTIICVNCEMKYQTDLLVKEIEDQLFLINTNEIGPETSFENLMAQPRLLKRNYFDFTS
ncbi:putative YokU family protein [Cytobacillus eiseniae]|uniref:YokU family protein n=1 Tax=Cytobacillus eiseniae TaxID=762947 RepID=A0ABS4RFT7_9BACI|nr:YokU family protein [Cytobacillus eiseniae]MBP2241230.1 putative YokU family protein [Cytobacillus eiseniae]